MTGASASRRSRSSYFALAGGKTEPPAIVVDYDGDVVRVIEGDGGAIERGIVEVPFWRRDLPNQLREVVPVFVITGLAAFCREVILIPPLELGFRRQRYFACFLAADQIAADGNHRLAALGPKRGDDVGGARAPIETADDRLLDARASMRAMMSTASADCWPLRGVSAGQEARCPITAQIWNDDAVARGRQQRRHIEIAVDVVGPAVEKDHGPVRRPDIGVADRQDAGLDLLQRAEGAVRSGRDRGQLAGLPGRRPDHSELGGGKGHRTRKGKDGDDADRLARV